MLEVGITQNISQGDSEHGLGRTSVLAKEKLHLPNQYDATRHLYEALEASTLIPFIEQKLQVFTSLKRFEVCSRINTHFLL